MPGGLREVVLSFKFRQNRVNRFRAVGGRKLPFPIPKATGLYNSLYYRTSRDCKDAIVSTVHAEQQQSKFLQATDVCWNKPFKDKLHELWMAGDDQKEYTTEGNLKAPSFELVL